MGLHKKKNTDKRYQKYQFEQLFRSFNLTLIDNASSEYLFIYEFFSRDPKTAADTAKLIFQFIFEPTEKVGMVITTQDHTGQNVSLMYINHRTLPRRMSRTATMQLDSYCVFESTHN